MQRADFENNVHQKMQELRFHPSDEVWKQVEAGIGSKRRRRPVVFWFILAGILILGGSYYYISHQYTENISGSKTEQPGQSIAGKQSEKKQENQDSGNQGLKDLSAASESTGPLNRDQPSSTNAIKPAKKTLSSKAVKSQHKKKTEEVSFETENFSVQQPTQVDNQFSLNRGMRNAKPNQFSESELLINSIGNPQVADENPLPVLAPTVENQAKKNSSTDKKTNWQFGMTASGGTSDLGEQLLQTAAGANFSYNPLQSTAGGGINRGPSEVKNGPAFSIGAYANKTLGKKWKLGMGIAYQYFSNTIKVGEKVDSMVVINQSNFAMDRVSQYYKSTGNSPYHNQYHFISIPIHAQWQFAKRFCWENGLVGSKMIKTNALHYDGVSGRYYEDRNLFNDYQLSATTAVLFGLNKNRIQIGPQIQYSFTNLLNTNTGNPKHLRSASIKANIELWQK